MICDHHILDLPVLLEVNENHDTISIRKQFDKQMNFIDKVLKKYKKKYSYVSFDWDCYNKVVINFERPQTKEELELESTEHTRKLQYHNDQLESHGFIITAP